MTQYSPLLLQHTLLLLLLLVGGNAGISRIPPPGIPAAPAEPPPRDNPPLVYLRLEEFPKYPLGGDQDHILRLFTKALSPSDVNGDLQMTGLNIPIFCPDTRFKLAEVTNNCYNIRLTILQGNIQIADGPSRLRLSDLGAKAFIVWHTFLDGHDIEVVSHQRVFGWCEWIRLRGPVGPNGRPCHNLHITIQLPLGQQ